MLIIAFTLGLLVIVAGMKLLAQTQRENLGNMFKYVSWFVVAMGFFALLGTFTCAIMKHCHRHERRNMCEYRMEDRGYMGGYDRMNCNGDNMDCGRSDMRGEHGMGNCSMHHGNCNNGNNCCQGSQCHEGMKGNCNMGMGDGDGGSCPMMNGHCTMMDSSMTDKKKK